MTSLDENHIIVHIYKIIINFQGELKVVFSAIFQHNQFLKDNSISSASGNLPSPLLVVVVLLFSRFQPTLSVISSQIIMLITISRLLQFFLLFVISILPSPLFILVDDGRGLMWLMSILISHPLRRNTCNRSINKPLYIPLIKVF